MNYTVNGKNYIADDGYVFRSKATGTLFKKLRLVRNDIIDNYDVIPEPAPQEEEITEEEQS